LKRMLLALTCAMAAVVAVASPAQAANHESRVAHVEWNPTDIQNHDGGQADYATTEWNLDRVDQHPNTLNGQYAPVYGFGNGVHAYVVDSGVRITHTQFQGRASYGWDYVDNDAIADDCLGHGTHVAGTIAGVNTGGARYASIVAVRVLDCNGNGTQTNVVNGLNWVRAHAVKPAVVNISIGFAGGNTAVDNAVAALINAGITVVTSAGNDGLNACTQSPARVAAAETVGWLNQNDSRNSLSNFGSCLDLFAPGSNIFSTCRTSDTATCQMSGTSMASPLTAAAAALYLRSFPTATPNQVMSWLNNRTTNGLVTSAGSGSPNKILYVGA
jgi:subtilisin family serine protease